MHSLKRNILLNPGPATTTDSVKKAQIIPDICPREEEFLAIMQDLQNELIKIVHGDLKKHFTVLFCGSGTINIDATISSLVPQGKKILILNNGHYSARAAEACQYYHIEHIDLQFPHSAPIDTNKVKQTLETEKNIACVYSCHHETGTGILNPIREIGFLARRHHCTHIVDTTSTYAMIPINIEEENIDFLMASAQKGLMAMTGLSYTIGNRALIEESQDFPTRSYYTNLYLQYKSLKETGQMRFTPPVQTIYATRQAIKEYWQEGEQAKWRRHQALCKEIYTGLEDLGFELMFEKKHLADLVVTVKYPQDSRWHFKKIHDYCYTRGYTIYPGKLHEAETFRLCAFGALKISDIKEFFTVFTNALHTHNITIPVS